MLIVGAGFGGLFAARALRRAPVDVTVVDRANYHLFQPLLYQVATGVLSEGDVAPPIRDVLRKQRNTRVLLGEVEQIDLAGPQADPGGVAHTAHRIQNSARLIGASRLAAAAAQVEARAARERGTRWRPTGGERRRLAHEWELTRAAIEQQAYAVAAAGERQ